MSYVKVGWNLRMLTFSLNGSKLCNLILSAEIPLIRPARLVGHGHLLEWADLVLMLLKRRSRLAVRGGDVRMLWILYLSRITDRII